MAQTKQIIEGLGMFKNTNFKFMNWFKAYSKKTKAFEGYDFDSHAHIKQKLKDGVWYSCIYANSLLQSDQKITKMIVSEIKKEFGKI